MLAIALTIALGIDDRPLEPDWVTLGLLLAVVGALVLVNVLLFRHPRQLVRERFASTRLPPLLGLREQIFQRLQYGTGFFYLVAGFALQLVGRFRPRPPDAVPEFP